MTTTDPNLEKAISQLGKIAEEKLTDHPKPMVLADYQDGLLDEKNSEWIEQHIAVCRTCSDTLLELAQPLSLPDDSPTLPGAQADIPARLRSPFVGIGGLLAAVLCVGFVHLLLENRSLHHQIITPRTTYQIQDLNPIDSLVRGEPDVKVIKTPLQQEELTLFLNTERSQAQGRYRIELEKDRSSVWKGWIEPYEGQFVFGLPSAFQKPGTWRLVIFSAGGDHSEVLLEYHFQLQNTRQDQR